MSILSGVFESRGVKRTLASVFAGLAVILPLFPATAPYAELATQIAGILGIAGVTHAAISK